MSLATESAPIANEVWDLARQYGHTVWSPTAHERVIYWHVTGCESLKPRSFHLTGRYYHTPQGIGIKRHFWYGARYLSVVGRQAFKNTVTPSQLLELKVALDHRIALAINGA